MTVTTIHPPHVRDAALALIAAGFNAKAYALLDGAAGYRVRVQYIDEGDPRFAWSSTRVEVQGLVAQWSERTCRFWSPVGFDFNIGSDGCSVAMKCDTPADAELIKFLFLRHRDAEGKIVGPGAFSASHLEQLRQSLTASLDAQSDEARVPERPRA